MDPAKNYKIKLDAAKILVKIYETYIKLANETDPDRKTRFKDEVLRLTTNRANILKKIKS
jgi:hypothetical protein